MKIRIRSHQFTISEPFFPGHPLSEVEAQALNAMRADRVKRCVERAVLAKLAVSLDGTSLTEAEHAELQDSIRQFDKGYRFSARHVLMGQQVAVDLEARAVAREHLIEAMNRQGQEIDPEVLEIEIENLVHLDWVQEQARARAGAKARVAQEALEELL